MRRIRIALAALVAMHALGALTAAGASASGPVWASCAKASPKNTGAYTDKVCSTESPSHEGKWELVDGIGKGKPFKGATESVELEQINEQFDYRMNCSKNKISGRYVAPEEVAGVVLSMSKCSSQPFGPDKGCSATTAPLAGQLGWIDQAKGEAGLRLTNEAEPETGVFVNLVSCFEFVKVFIRGSVIVHWTPTGVITKEPALYTRAVNKFEEERHCGAGYNVPVAFEGEEGARNVLTGEEGLMPPIRCNEAALTLANSGLLQLKGEALMVH